MIPIFRDCSNNDHLTDNMSSHPLSKLMPSQDNMSKLLPAVPDMDTQLQLAAKMIDKNTATHKVKDLRDPGDSFDLINCRVSTVMVPTSSSTP